MVTGANAGLDRDGLSQGSVVFFLQLGSAALSDPNRTVNETTTASQQGIYLILNYFLTEV